MAEAVANEVEWLTKGELAERLSCGVTTIETLMREGLPHLRVGPRLVRFDLNQVLAFLRARQQTGVAP